MKRFIITRIGSKPIEYWNNELGWTEYKCHADIYTAIEMEAFNAGGIPIEGQWTFLDNEGV